MEGLYLIAGERGIGYGGGMRTTLIALMFLLIGCAAPKASAPSVPAAPVVRASPTRPSVSSTDELVLSKESLGVSKSEVPNGQVVVRKVITTTPASVTVDLKTESYEIVRVAPSGQSPDFSPKEIGLELKKDVASAVVTAQVVEVVKLNKVVTTEGSTLNGNVRSESVQIIK